MEKFSYKSLFTIVFILIAGIIFLVRINGKITKVSATWWNDSWMYRQSINISSHTTAESNVYITTSINIGTTTKANANDGDFRFLDSTGQTLSYYIVSGIGTTNITFHIQFSSFPSGPQTIYAYYGNPSATNGFSSSDFSTQATNYTIGSLGSEEIGGGPIAYWKFDEGIGTTIHDSSQNNNFGTFATGVSAPSWATSEKCISQSCLYLNGKNYAWFNSTNSNNLDTKDFTIQTWIKTGTVADNRNLFNKGAGSGTSGWRFGLSNGIPNILIGDSSSFSEGSFGTTSIADNKWHFLSVVFNRASVAEAFVDGKSVGTKNISAYNGSVNSSSGIYIGRPFGSFTGFLDEAKIYPYARTAAQIKQDYNSGLSGQSSSEGSNVAMGGSSNKSLSDGLVAYWKMDEGTGTTSADYSGNNNTMIFGTSAPSWGTGKYGIGVSFGGLGDYTYINNSTSVSSINSNDKITISTWFKQTDQSNYDRLITSNWGGSGGWIFALNSGKPTFGFSVGSTQYRADMGTTVPMNIWHHMVGTYDGFSIKLYIDSQLTVSSTLPAFDINSNNQIITFSAGGATEGFFGNLDEVRVYNRAISSDEVSELYNYAPSPVAYYKFEEGSGNTAYDSSGNGNNGVLSGTTLPTWSTGKIGKALSFNGTSSYVDIGNNSLLNPTTKFSIEAWVKPSSIASSTNYNIFAKENYGGKLGFRLILSGWAGAGNPNSLQLSVGNSTTLTYVVGSNLSLINTWYHIAATYDSGIVKIYTNGILTGQSTTSVTSIVNSPAGATIGRYSTGGEFFPGLIDQVRFYDYARTPKQILEDMNTGVAQKSPVAWYKFDEGSNTIINNSGSVGSALNGTLTGTTLPTWSNSGKFNKALAFNGISSYVSVPNASFFGTGQQTLSIWAKPNRITAATRGFIFAHASTGDNNRVYILQDTAGTIMASMGTSAGYNIILAANYSVGQWLHIVITRDYTNQKLNAWVNGIQKITNQSVAIGGTSTATSNIGAISGTEVFDGLIDEVKLYNYALSPDEIKTEYNQGSSTVFGSSNQTIGATTTSLDYCLPGDASACSAPVAEWKFEEGTGTTTYDSTGSGNNIYFGTGSSAPSWATGKIGKGLGFFSAQKTNTNLLSGSAPITYSLWAKGTTGYIFHQGLDDTTWRTVLYISVSNLNWSYYDGATKTIINPWDSTRWNHVELVHNGTFMQMFLNGIAIGSTVVASTNSNYGTFRLGMFGASTGGFNGQIDNVRIYNYARTPAQVAYDYNKGGPVGWWKFDECQGNIAHDSSGVGNTGIISIGASGTQNTLGTCSVGTSAAWTAGVSGKANSSLNFDGTDDYVSTADSPSLDMSTMTVAGWIKTTNSSEQCIVERNNTTFYFCTNGGKLRYWINGVAATWLTSNKSINDNLWHHVTGTWDGTNKKLYIDGHLDIGSTGTGGNIVNTTYGLNIGARVTAGVPQYYFNGKIDDIRLYNYPLTATQIKQIYNGGAVNFK